MEKYTELNAQMETIACIIRRFYLFEDKHNSEKDIKFICDFVNEMREHENINEIDKKYQSLLDEYLSKIDEVTIKKVAPDIKI